MRAIRRRIDRQVLVEGQERGGNDALRQIVLVSWHGYPPIQWVAPVESCAMRYSVARTLGIGAGVLRLQSTLTILTWNGKIGRPCESAHIRGAHISERKQPYVQTRTRRGAAHALHQRPENR